MGSLQTSDMILILETSLLIMGSRNMGVRFIIICTFLHFQKSTSNKIDK